jgi:hypothetical protein
LTENGQIFDPPAGERTFLVHIICALTIRLQPCYRFIARARLGLQHALDECRRRRVKCQQSDPPLDEPIIVP